MNRWVRVTVIVVVLAAAAAVLALKQRGAAAGPSGSASGVSEPVAAEAAPSAVGAPAAQDVPAAALPKLVSLGSGSCVPCRMMEPIRAELRTECVGRMAFEHHDVKEERGVAERFGIRVIPTLIFYDAQGRELARHEGFLSKDDIRAKWRALGVDLRCGNRG